MSTIQIRIDSKIKKEAKKVLDKVGLDMSSAIKVYLAQIVVTQGIPFQIITENGLTMKEEREILKASKEAKHGVNVSEQIESTKKLKAHLDSLK